MIARKYHELTVKDIHQETEDCVSIAFEIPAELQDHYQFKAGQYLNFKIVVDGNEIRRSYSLSSSPHEKEWRIAVKKVENGRFSEYVNHQLKVNDTIEVMTPIGTFTTEFDVKNNKEYVLVAAGSGITPVISVIKEILATEPKSNVTLFYGNKGFNSVIFREQIQAIKDKHLENFRVIHIFSRENLGNEIQTGRITGEKFEQLIDAFLKNQPIDEVFICGPDQMIRNVQQVCLNHHIQQDNVHVELFGTEILSKQEEAEDASTKSEQIPEIHTEVQIIIDGDEYNFPMNSSQKVLDAGLESGIDLPFSCKGGVCCTCRAKVLEGEVRMDVNYALSDEEVSQGYVLTCQSHPTTKKLVVSFDE